MTIAQDQLSQPSLDMPPNNRSHRFFRARTVIIGVGLLLVALLVWRLAFNTRGTSLESSRSGQQAPAQSGPSHGGSAKGGAPLPPVAVAKATPGSVPITLNELGTVTPIATITVRTQINGQLQTVAFHEGQEVKRGDFLAEIDSRPYRIALEQAKGNMARDQALLSNAKHDLARYQQLVAEDSIAHQQLDTQASLVAQYKGAIETDQAAVDSAKLNLVYCHITAPIDGRVGLRQVDEGNYVQVSDPNGVVVLTQIHPISVIFTVPEDNVPRVMQRLASGAKLPVTAFDRAGVNSIAEGFLVTVDNQVDPSTGTLKMRAHFDNSTNTLFPDQFVNIRLLVDTLANALIVPSAAVQQGAQGNFVYQVQADMTVKVVKVTLGPMDGQNVAIVSGLQAGDTVVTDGMDRLRDGATVTMVTNDHSTQGNNADNNSSAADGNTGTEHKPKSP